MNKLITFLLIFIFIISTAITKNSTKKIEEKIYKMIEIYTDGACSVSSRKGGWGTYIIITEKEEIKKVKLYGNSVVHLCNYIMCIPCFHNFLLPSSKQTTRK